MNHFTYSQSLPEVADQHVADLLRHVAQSVQEIEEKGGEIVALNLDNEESRPALDVMYAAEACLDDVCAECQIHTVEVSRVEGEDLMLALIDALRSTLINLKHTRVYSVQIGGIIDGDTDSAKAIIFYA